MIITKEFLTKKSACKECVKFVTDKSLIGLEAFDFINRLMELNHFDWANWLIVRCLNYKGYVGYAVFAAEQVIDIYERKYPNDKIPRNAINAAKKCIENPSIKNETAAYAAADSAVAAAYAADATDAATYAAVAAAYTDAAAKKEMQIKIINYGLILLEK